MNKFQVAAFQKGESEADAIRYFATQREAESFAKQCGATEWVCEKNSRIVPIAVSLPIRFPNAPDPETLKNAEARLLAGEAVDQVVFEVRESSGIQMNSICLLAWIIGMNPANDDMRAMLPDWMK